MSTIKELREEIGILVSRFPEDVGEMRLRLEMHLNEHGLPTSLVAAGFTVLQVMDSMTVVIYNDAPAILEETRAMAQKEDDLSNDVFKVVLRVVREALLMANFVFEE
ncbi:MAG: hypothetical protein HOA57_01470 [Candidatus Magasanikbacteria bacterium]|jgi:hypothetical protein|nr:hypothetical protein [Candidatus Magasanikbacteria bacterium]MBT4315170.1 hypothetical protein [Candidatus Magasanikbacteria bacterium]MBT4547374.1 hypothetical protein [Candidatus Magasanikbacteria bacterium]MBT6819025.1 hypothetical protein [Candidatus Magasanikbacteria bacterium]